jgi:hypothetical protein
MGNQPAWITRWLQDNNVIAYYFSGDAGMGPTRVYRAQGRDGDHIWAFPILHFGADACLEEMEVNSVAPSAVEKWLFDIANFTASEHVARLFYSHPIGALNYIRELQDWFNHADELSRQGEFRWYTMTHLAEFLNSRQQVAWQINRRGSTLELTAVHPRSLEHQAWMLPDARYKQPKITEGSADIRDQDGYWIVAAKDCKRLKLELAERQNSNTNPRPES